MSSSIYGGITYENSSFVFDKVYPNYQAAKEDIITNNNKSGILVGRYILIKYCETALDQDIKVKIHTNPDGTFTGDQDSYRDNYKIDNKISHDRMVYRVIFNTTKGGFALENIASLNTTIGETALKDLTTLNETYITEVRQMKADLESITVDQSFNSTSTHAQSGIAVAQALTQPKKRDQTITTTIELSNTTLTELSNTTFTGLPNRPFVTSITLTQESGTTSTESGTTGDSNNNIFSCWNSNLLDPKIFESSIKTLSEAVITLDDNGWFCVTGTISGENHNKDTIINATTLLPNIFISNEQQYCNKQVEVAPKDSLPTNQTRVFINLSHNNQNLTNSFYTHNTWSALVLNKFNIDTSLPTTMKIDLRNGVYTNFKFRIMLSTHKRESFIPYQQFDYPIQYNATTNQATIYPNQDIAYIQSKSAKNVTIVAYQNLNDLLNITHSAEIATKDYVHRTIKNHDLSTPPIDLSNYVTQSQLEEKPGKTSGTGQEIFNDYTNNKAIGLYSHSEGYTTKAEGNYSHAEGKDTIASGNYSHASGLGTKATKDNQTAIGCYNETNDTALLIVGNGQDDVNRSNAFMVYPDGHAILNNERDLSLDDTGFEDNWILTKKDIDYIVNTQANVQTTTTVSGSGEASIKVTTKWSYEQWNSGKTICQGIATIQLASFYPSALGDEEQGVGGWKGWVNNALGDTAYLSESYPTLYSLYPKYNGENIFDQEYPIHCQIAIADTDCGIMLEYASLKGVTEPHTPGFVFVRPSNSSVVEKPEVTVSFYAIGRWK